MINRFKHRPKHTHLINIFQFEKSFKKINNIESKIDMVLQNKEIAQVKRIHVQVRYETNEELRHYPIPQNEIKSDNATSE